MKALVFHHPGRVEVNQVEHPEDVLLRVTSTAICGSDLHIYNGFFPQVKDMILGHEFMGVIEETGPEVNDLRQGDRVVVPFPIACGRCFFCHDGLPGHCENSNPEKYGPEGGLLDQKGGGLFGYTDFYGGYSGGQAEYVRVPYANFGPRKVPEGFSDEEVLFLSDISSTGPGRAHGAEGRLDAGRETRHRGRPSRLSPNDRATDPPSPRRSTPPERMRWK